MIRAIIYLITPKRIVAKAYIKTLLNEQGFYWSKLPPTMLDELALYVLEFTRNLMAIGFKESFPVLLAKNCKVVTYQLCDWLEGKPLNQDVVDEVKNILKKYDLKSDRSKI